MPSTGDEAVDVEALGAGWHVPHGEAAAGVEGCERRAILGERERLDSALQSGEGVLHIARVRCVDDHARRIRTCDRYELPRRFHGHGVEWPEPGVDAERDLTPWQRPHAQQAIVRCGDDAVQRRLRDIHRVHTGWMHEWRTQPRTVLDVPEPDGAIQSSTDHRGAVWGDEQVEDAILVTQQGAPEALYGARRQCRPFGISTHDPLGLRRHPGEGVGRFGRCFIVGSVFLRSFVDGMRGVRGGCGVRAFGRLLLYDLVLEETARSHRRGQCKHSAPRCQMSSSHGDSSGGGAESGSRGRSISADPGRGGSASTTTDVLLETSSSSAPKCVGSNSASMKARFARFETSD